MLSTPGLDLRPRSTKFAITQRGSVLFDDVALTSGPVMKWQGGEQRGNFAVESATPVPILRGERLVISGSDGTSRSITVTEMVDNVVYFRSDNRVDSLTPSSAFGERWANPQRFQDAYSGRAAAGV